FEPEDLGLLRLGATGLPMFSTDTRVKNFDHLLNGVFQITGPTMPYASFTGDMVHRLFHMWQQSDCNTANATRENPSGCLNDLYPFVITSYTSEPDPFIFPIANQVGDNGGGNSMAFYDVQAGDAPVLKRLADEFSMSDNFHQSFMGGTGANHVMLGTGDAIFWSDNIGNPATDKGNPVKPPARIANPDPITGTDDVYTVDLF